MDFPAIISATLPVTHDPVEKTQGHMSWHQSITSLVLAAPHGRLLITPLNALGFVTKDKRLECENTYAITGPLGHNIDTDTLTVKHSATNQTAVGEFPHCYRPLAGKATLSGVGLITKVTFKEVLNDFTDWHMIVHAKHQFDDPLTHETTTFVVCYKFRSRTPPISDTINIVPGSTMWLHGNIVTKDVSSLHLVVIVTAFRVM